MAPFLLYTPLIDRPSNDAGGGFRSGPGVETDTEESWVELGIALGEGCPYGGRCEQEAQAVSRIKEWERVERCAARIGRLSVLCVLLAGCAESGGGSGVVGCAPGEWKCEGNTPFQCAPLNRWIEHEACSALEMCVESSEGLEPTCSPILEGVLDGAPERAAQNNGSDPRSEEGVSAASDTSQEEKTAEEESVEDDGDTSEDLEENGGDSSETTDTFPSDSEGEEGDTSEASGGGGGEGEVTPEDGADGSSSSADESVDAPDSNEENEEEGSDGEDVSGDACEDEKLTGVFDETALQGKLLAAGLACQFPDDFGSMEHAICLRDQFMETGIGPDCADCFTNFVLCFFSECGDACTDIEGNPEPCTQCMDTTSCTGALDSCAGLEWSTNSSDG